MGTDYVEYQYDLSAYAGQDIYLAIHWIYNFYAMIVEDVKVGQNQPNDVGMLSIETPEDHHHINTEIFPAGTIQNFGSSQIDVDFEITCEITDESSTVVYNDTYLHNGTLLPNATETISFTTSWIPTETGYYSVSMTSNLADDAYSENDNFTFETRIVEHYGIGGPDEYGYMWIDNEVEDGPEYNWIEISETGASAIMHGVPSFDGDDNFCEAIDFGFDFPFYGIDRSHFYVDTNGEILLAENDWVNPYPDSDWGEDGFSFNSTYPIPGFTQMPGLVAVFWDSQRAIEGTGDIYYQTFGEAPDRYCVVEWQNFEFDYDLSGEPTLCYEAIFYESGEIIFQYQNTDNGQTGYATPHIDGRSSTVAIQNDEATIGLCYLQEVRENNNYVGVEPLGNLLKNGLAIKFYPSDDNYPPTFSYEECGSTFSSDLTFVVEITDMSEIESDTLYYDIGNGWQGISHTGFEEPNIYTYELTGIPNSTDFNYYFVATDNASRGNRGTLPANAPTEYFSFKMLPTEGVNILFAHAGIVPGYQDWNYVQYPKYINALEAAGATYDIYNWDEYEDFAFPDDYNVIITYGNNVGFDRADKIGQALMDFVDMGTNENPKNVFYASDEHAHDSHNVGSWTPRTIFMKAYVRGAFFPDISPNYPDDGGTDGIGGPDTYEYTEGSFIVLDDSPLGTQGQEIFVYSNSPDALDNYDSCPESYVDMVVNPEIGSHKAFEFLGGPFEEYGYGPGDYAYANEECCGLWIDNLIYKMFFFSFDISQINDDNEINMLIADALNWFEVLQPLNPPQNLFVTESGYATWDEPASRDLLGYNVYLDGELYLFTTNLFYQFTGLINGQTYIAGVSAAYDNGESEIIEYEFIYNGTDADDKILFVTELQGNYPNPFNPETKISFSTSDSSENTELEIYNLKGQKVKTLVDEKLEVGNHSVIWNGKDDFGKPVTSGIYFYKFKSGKFTSTKKMIMMK
ncbi:MAG: T9SS type A sorting domain-containing protein [Candidatus Cloacimonetes bacterium]|nr:T9SS type A sorting domain-containing protein [Candidatus Cloacimonadota bacterium]